MSSNETKMPKPLPMALKITTVYVVIGGLWILFSDALLGALYPEPSSITRYQTLKGWFFIAATGFLLFLLISRNTRMLEHTNDALVESEELLARTLETIVDGVLIISREGTITFANLATEKIFGRDRADIMWTQYNCPSWDVRTPEGDPFPLDERPFVRVISTREPVYDIEYTVLRPDKSRALLSVNGAPLRNKNGDLLGVVISMRDITEKREAEQKVARAITAEQLARDEAEESKRQFYKGTIFSVTEGKLILVDRDEARALIPEENTEIVLHGNADISNVRAVVSAMARNVQMDYERTHSLITAVGEAATNALKHAGGGSAMVGVNDGKLRVCICDDGSGMDALILPRVTLTKGFSTKPSMGLGYSLILALVDQVYLATGRTGTCVVIEQNIEQPAEELTPDLIDRFPDTW